MTRASPQILMRCGAKVDQKEMGLVIFGKVALRDVLLVADEISKADSLVIEHLEKPGRATAVLDIGLPFTIYGRKKNARLRLDEACEVGIDAGLPAAPFLDTCIAAAGPLAGLPALTDGVNATSLE